MRVLIADDSEVIVQRLMALLAHVRGVEIVDQVGTVEETREAVRRLRPDAVILDMQMPGGSGIDVLEEHEERPANFDSHRVDEPSLCAVPEEVPSGRSKILFWTSQANLKRSAKCCKG